MSAAEGGGRAEDPVVARARAAIGARFRLHGRDPAYGLDCVGLVAWATGAPDVPADYPLRGGTAERACRLIGAWARPVAVGRPGDVVLMSVGAEQFHLAILTENGLIHADAGLRRVVERPGPSSWPVIGRWRAPATGPGATSKGD